MSAAVDKILFDMEYRHLVEYRCGNCGQQFSKMHVPYARERCPFCHYHLHQKRKSDGRYS